MHHRQYQLDWLRVMVFFLLIFYHIGMLYVADWGFHYKSQYSSEFLQNLMLLVNRWRLPILFMISGIAMRYYLQKTTWIGFGLSRTVRLLIPLFFAVLVVIPPQLYVEMIGKGDLNNTSYWSFYRAFFDLDHPMFENYQSGLLPHMDVNHMWYVRELWWFSLTILCLSPLLNSRYLQSIINWLANGHVAAKLLLLPVMVLCLCTWLIFPDGGEGYRIVLGFSFMLIGYMWGWHEKLWNAVNQHRKFFLYTTLVCYVLFIYYYQTVWKVQEIPATGLQYLYEISLSHLTRWSAILAILGYGTHHLNHTSPLLRYLNEAVYPYYILHQTLLIVAAWYLTPFQLGGIIESSAVIVITVIGSLVGFEIIRRFKVLRLLFGLKITPLKPVK